MLFYGCLFKATVYYSEVLCEYKFVVFFKLNLEVIHKK